MQLLTGKTAVVLGGGTGIGKGIAAEFVQQDCRVVIGGRREDKLKAAAAEIDGDVQYIVVDVGDRASVESFFQSAHQKLGTIDILVNSAGTNIKTRTMGEMTPDQWDHVMRINATGAYNAMYQVMPEMRKRGDGLIINISSIAGKRAAALGGVAYCASKFAMTALGTAVSNEVASEGIRITNVYPGEVDTPILENRPQPVSDERRATMLKPEDVAALVLTIACLPPRAHVPEIIIKPTVQEYV